jgi:two-component system cell cycle response regulator DivK
MAKILYMEDISDQRVIVKQMLELNGHEVLLASDGQEGVELAKKQVRENPGTKHIPIIAMSAWLRERDIAQAVGAGADAYLGKPYDGARLLALVEEHLSK